MQSSNLVSCNGGSACFVVGLSGCRRRWMEGEGGWWEEIVRQLASFLLHLGRGSKADVWMNVYNREKSREQPPFPPPSPPPFPPSSPPPVRAHFHLNLSYCLSFNLCFSFLALPYCYPATQCQPALHRYLCCYGNWNIQYRFFPFSKDTMKTSHVYDQLNHLSIE